MPTPAARAVGSRPRVESARGDDLMRLLESLAFIAAMAALLLGYALGLAWHGLSDLAIHAWHGAVRRNRECP